MGRIASPPPFRYSRKQATYLLIKQPEITNRILKNVPATEQSDKIKITSLHSESHEAVEAQIKTITTAQKAQDSETKKQKTIKVESFSLAGSCKPWRAFP